MIFSNFLLGKWKSWQDLLISYFLQFICSIPLLQADLLPAAAAPGGPQDPTVHAANTPQVSCLLEVKYLGDQTKKY